MTLEFPNVRVLIVDDSPEDRETYRRYLLKMEGVDCQVFEADGFEEGLAFVNKLKPDCILLDYHMAECTGLDFVHELRRSGQLVPIVMLTGETSQSVAIDVLKAGVSDYLNKNTLRRADLENAVCNMLRKAKIEKSKLQSEAHLRRRATIDTLTGLPNRSCIDEIIGDGLAKSPAEGGLSYIMLVDLDGFKPVNDCHGHAAGDEVLRVVAQRMREVMAGKCRSSVIKERGSAGRLGGDEFVLIGLGSVSRAEAEEVASELLHRLSDAIEHDGIQHQIGASIGIAMRLSSENASQLLSQADSAMYVAKRSGKGRTVTYCSESTLDETECVLIVEDLKCFRVPLVRNLKRRGFRVFEASSFQEAISVLDEHAAHLSLVLTDVDLDDSGGNGIDLARESKKRNSNLPVLVMTGSHDMTNAVEALRAGAVDFLRKPFETEDLDKAIARSRKTQSR